MQVSLSEATRAGEGNTEKKTEETIQGKETKVATDNLKLLALGQEKEALFLVADEKFDDAFLAELEKSNEGERDEEAQLPSTQHVAAVADTVEQLVEEQEPFSKPSFTSNLISLTEGVSEHFNSEGLEEKQAKRAERKAKKAEQKVQKNRKEINERRVSKLGASRRKRGVSFDSALSSPSSLPSFSKTPEISKRKQREAKKSLASIKE